MSRPNTFTYKVSLQRSAIFPLDMLRYAESWPTTAADGSTIERMISDNMSGSERGRVEITLSTIHDTRVDRSAAFINMKKRWESFGAIVTQPDDNVVEPERQTLDSLLAEDELVEKIEGLRRLMTDTTMVSERFKQNAINDECASIADRLTGTSAFTIRALAGSATNSLTIARRLLNPVPA